jgi:hypothetical protein
LSGQKKVELTLCETPRSWRLRGEKLAPNLFEGRQSVRQEEIENVEIHHQVKNCMSCDSRIDRTTSFS